MVAGTDAPSWTFGLNPKVPVALVPGPGTYNVGGELTSVGPRFGRIGTPMIAQQDPKRLVFDGDRRKEHSPRFPEAALATDAGPGAYISPEYKSQGPCVSIAARPPRSLERPESPGPGQYVRVRLASQGKHATGEVAGGFGKRSSPRFGSDGNDAGAPGPGTYQDPFFKPSTGKDITFGRLIRPAGCAAKIRDITRFSWELECDSGDEGDHRSSSRDPCFGASPRTKPSEETTGCCCRRRRGDRSRRPSSAPASSRLLRACARGRKHYHQKHNASGAKYEGSNKVSRRARESWPIAALIKKDGRRRKAQTIARVDGSGGGLSGTNSPRARATVFATVPQRPCEKTVSPGPAAYHPQTLDDAARAGRVLGLSGKTGRELFPSPPDTPGPGWYSPEVLQGPAVARAKKAAGWTAQGKIMGVDDDVRLKDAALIARDSSRAAGLAATTPAAAATAAAAAAGTFGSSERFPKDPECARRPGVGEYDLRAAERAAGGASVALPVTFGRRAPAASAPYDPSLGRYLRADDRSTPSPHAYRPETAAGGGGKCGVGGHAPGPPAWSFGGKRKDPRPPSGPGPGGRVFAYEPSPPAVRFGVGRAWTPAVVSGVPWEKAAERSKRGEGGGVGAKLYLPGRTRFGARAYMSARRVPVPRRG